MKKSFILFLSMTVALVFNSCSENGIDDNGNGNVRYILEIWKEKMFQKSLLTRFLITSRDLQKKNCSQNYPTRKSLLTWMVVTKQCFSMTNLKRMRCSPLRFGMEKWVVFQDHQQTHYQLTMFGLHFKLYNWKNIWATWKLSFSNLGRNIHQVK